MVEVCGLVLFTLVCCCDEGGELAGQGGVGKGAGKGEDFGGF